MVRLLAGLRLVPGQEVLAGCGAGPSGGPIETGEGAASLRDPARFVHAVAHVRCGKSLLED